MCAFIIDHKFSIEKHYKKTGRRYGIITNKGIKEFGMAEEYITLDEWIKKYEPETFHGYVAVYETYGDNVEMVYSKNPNLVWTLIEYDGIKYIGSGMQLVNREGYFICKKEWEGTEKGEVWVALTKKEKENLVYMI